MVMFMNIGIPAYGIDLIIVVFFLIMLFIGYKKGFVTRFYDIATTILVFALSFALCTPLSDILKIYAYGNDIISTTVGPMINKVVVFIVLFIILFVIKIAVGLAIKPIMKSLVDKLHLTKKINGYLGVILSFLESFIIAYMVLALVVTPLFSNGEEKIEETVLASKILSCFPEYSEQLMSLTNQYTNLSSLTNQSVSDKDVLKNLMVMTINGYNSGLLSQQKAADIIQNQLASSIIKYPTSLTSSQMGTFAKLLSATTMSSDAKKKVLSNITVSD